MISQFSFGSSDSVWPPSSLEAQTVKNPPAMQEAWVPSLGREDPLEEGCEPHSHAEPRPLHCCGSAMVRGPRVSVASSGDRGRSFGRPMVHWPKFKSRPLLPARETGNCSLNVCREREREPDTGKNSSSWEEGVGSCDPEGSFEPICSRMSPRPWSFPL